MSHTGMTEAQSKQYVPTVSSIADIAPVLLPTPAGRFLHKYRHKAVTVQHVLRKIETSLMEEDLNTHVQGIIIKLDDVLNETSTVGSPFQIELLIYLHNRLYPLGWNLLHHPQRPDHVIIKPLLAGSGNVNS